MSTTRVALVTGGSYGIGSVVVRKLVEQDIFVYINYSKSQEQAESLEAEIMDEGGRARIIRADVSIESEVKDMFSAIEDEFNCLDYLINNAGIDIPNTIESSPLDDWHRVIEVNLIGKYLMIKNAIPLLRNSGYPCIINLSSRLGRKPLTNYSAYSCSSAAVLMLTRCAALELSQYGIRVNTIIPGLTKTPMTMLFFPNEEEWRDSASRNPSQRICTPLDVANAIAFLLSEQASYVNGTEIIVDGGASLV